MYEASPPKENDNISYLSHCHRMTDIYIQVTKLSSGLVIMTGAKRKSGDVIEGPLVHKGRKSGWMNRSTKHQTLIL